MIKHNNKTNPLIIISLFPFLQPPLFGWELPPAAAPPAPAALLVGVRPTASEKKNLFIYQYYLCGQMIKSNDTYEESSYFMFSCQNWTSSISC